MTAEGEAVPLGAGRRVRTATLDAQPGRLEHATARAILAAGVEVVMRIGPADPRSFGERAQALRDARPDVVLVPLVDRGSADRLILLCEALRFGCASQRPLPRVVIASDDDGAISRASRALAPFETEVLPDLRSDEGRAGTVARLRQLRRGDQQLRDEALEELARGLAEARSGLALVADVGGGSTSLVLAEPGAIPVALHSRPLGVGTAADAVIAEVGLDRVRRWIPGAMDAPTIFERVFQRSRWPHAIATDRDLLALEIALAHEALARVLAQGTAAGVGERLRDARTLLVTGHPSRWPGAWRAVLAIADALEPSRPVSILRDDDDALVAEAAGALATGDRSGLLAAIAERSVALGAIVPIQRATTVHLRGSGAAREEHVRPGALYTVRLEGEVEVETPGVAAQRVSCGALGVVIDARQRPLQLPPRDAERVRLVAGWQQALEA